MAKKLTGFKTKGMNKDLSVSAFNPEFAFENMNLRLSTNEGNTLLSWVNEKGTEAITWVTGDWKDSGDGLATVTSIEGTPVGISILNRQLILFTHSSSDRIYAIKYHNPSTPSMKGKLLYQGNLEFDTEHPLETLVSYESENIQKVYWVDGKNQPRVINIEGDYKVGGNFKEPFIFDFVPELQLQETVAIKKLLGASGMFAPGVIQYAFTYYNKNGQETNIFYTSPLLYTSFLDRGGSPEDKVDNAFRINISNVDKNFDYLRIYSIQRTSIDGTPLCKRIQDINLNDLKPAETSVSYTDTGTSGNYIDPTELLYKGGTAIKAKTIEQKDNTLFLGNIEIVQNDASTLGLSDYLSVDTINPHVRNFKPQVVSSSNYLYSNQLTSTTMAENRSVPCAGFKHGDVYRCGVQFQHKTGKWSDPIYIGNYPVLGKPSAGEGSISVPVLKGTVSSSAYNILNNAGYKKVRAVVVFPSMQDRLTLCQGVSNPTVNRTEGNLNAQSSWFFRPSLDNTARVLNIGAVAPATLEPDGGSGYLKDLKYTRRNITQNSPDAGFAYNPNSEYIRQVEIQGDYDDKFKINTNILTLHSPELEFDTQYASTEFSSLLCKYVGKAEFTKTFSDISIQTETPTASNNASGFIHKSFIAPKAAGIVAGLFYDDYVINDSNGSENDIIGAYDEEYSPCKWMVYPWNKTGSLNNDINRPTDKGVATAVLKKKVISNLRFSDTSWNETESDINLQNTSQLFSSDEPIIIKIGNQIYAGNIDTILTPDKSDGVYFAFNSDTIQDAYNVFTSFASTAWCKTFYDETEGSIVGTEGALWKYRNGVWSILKDDIGNVYQGVSVKKDFVRMKYKSTPHLVLHTDTDWYSNIGNAVLPIFEIRRNITSERYYTLFGGESTDALKENIWIPCGEPEPLSPSGTDFEYSYGDTYYQRYDCLKTYAYTPEDENQIVEIGSFMLETRVNIDGRYDRNRGQLNNLNMSPRNFNLLNPVYSQLNNFFTYRIQNSSYYQDTIFPNQVTWSKTKESGADVDQWTNVTLASILELDGDKGKLNKLIRFNNYLFAFQDTGISQILYNDNVQVSSTDGVPIEIANSGKVQGKDYKSSTIGCSNKWSMATTSAGIYFMDSHDKSIYLFNGQLQNLSNQGGFASWAKNNIFLTGQQWSPNFSTSDFVTYYDKLNQDVLFINGTTALAWSEKLQAFTSFYSYEHTPFFCNLDDTGIWIKNGESATTLWKHQAGNYCSFFDANNYSNKPYWMTLIGNPEPQMDKTFTNLEFRACVDGEGTTKVENSTTVFDKPFIPFDFLETWDEYQHGIAQIDIRSGHNLFKHHPDNTTGAGATLIRKFRIWRCDIPRDNVIMTSAQPSASTPTTYTKDVELGITRYSRRPMDRMRNPWLYLKLMKNVPQSGTLPRAEIHDVVMTYFE